jgi:probable rRNA maturation factor
MATKRRESKVSRVQHKVAAIENGQRAVRVELARLERFLLRVNRELGLHPDAVFVRFIADTEMAHLNRTFRKKPRTTDVLSFPSETRSRPGGYRRRARALRGSFLGDIAISPVVARRNAKRFGRTMTAEICILMLHGVLHLLGYDHQTDRGEMERVEAMLRLRLGLS